MRQTSRIWSFSIQLSPKGPWITSQRPPASLTEAAQAAAEYLIASADANIEISVKLTRVAPISRKPDAEPYAEFPPDQTLRPSHRTPQTQDGEE